jgi:hypothetical protein
MGVAGTLMAGILRTGERLLSTSIPTSFVS